jgi:hypothetical protein
MLKLIYLPNEGWEEEFETKEELQQKLYQCICVYCRDGEKIYNRLGELIYESTPVNSKSSIGDLLATACGCEFWIEYDT